MSNLQVANEILKQLGGQRFITMTGAKNFLGTENSISFRIPGTMTKNKINFVRITLFQDLYKFEFKNIRGMNIKDISEFEGIYVDRMKELFESQTGLYTSL